MESQELIRLTRDAGEEAYVRPEWVDRWVANGWNEAKVAAASSANDEIHGDGTGDSLPAFSGEVREAAGVRRASQNKGR